MVDVVNLGAQPVGGTIHHLRRRIIALELDTSHFDGGRRLGQCRRPVSDGFDRLGLDTSHFLGQARYLGTAGRTRLSPGCVLVHRPNQQGRSDSKKVRRAMLAAGVPEMCAGCGTGPRWCGLPMTLEVDHISGDFRDNRRENLRLLCPNCHATTNTYCRKRQIS
jgi:HNH endonuclease